jgi:flagellar export protein FliJ
VKRFKFSLQAVHNVREVRRDAAERDLAAVAAELRVAHAHLDKVLHKRQMALENCLVLQQSQAIEAVTLASHTDYIGSLILHERHARLLILQIEERVEGKRKVLTEAARQTETTANLRERQRERHHLEMAQHEQKLLDDMAVLASTRRRSAHGEQ